MSRPGPVPFDPAVVRPDPDPDPDSDLDLDHARRLIAARLQPVAGIEEVALQDALGRVLAEAAQSPIDVPGHDNSAMDGFAFDGAALQAGAPLPLRCTGRLLAGQWPSAAPPAGTCLRIMTGAVMPPGTDTVVPLEACRIDGDSVHIPADALRRGANVRTRGEDLAQGQTALPAGRVLRPADLGLLASLGLATVRVRRRLRVAVFSSGDELAAAGQALQPGAIYDSNRHSLLAAVRRLGCEALDFGLVRDEPEALAATLQRAAAEADVVLTSGGVSAGDADHTRAVLAQQGALMFWKLAMRPGRPFAFGRLQGGAWLLALPGNPVAALVSFYAIARGALLQLAGAQHTLPLTLRARCGTALAKRVGRAEFQRARIEHDALGVPIVTACANQSSGVLRSMSEADVLIVLPAARGPVAAGEMVDVWPLDGLV